ncbi:MAG TPA: hypothetical protein VEY91_04105 [Candidatus Limnocylindria bacterium]|nr:hypothetical protein [Candidatus Limnocylindria bacterium]
MKSRLAWFLALVLALPSIAESQARHYEIRLDPTEIGHFSVHIYTGSLNTLPYGMNDGPDVARHALTMPCVQAAIDRMLAQGYLRRVDLDAGFTRTGYSCAAVGFEKPGHAVTERQPVVLVITKPEMVEGIGIIPATQVLAGVVTDSADVLVAVVGPADSAMAVSGTNSNGFDGMETPGGGTGSGTVEPERDDEDFVYRYSAHEVGGWTDWRARTSPGAQCLWTQWDQRVRTGTISSMIGGMGGFINGWNSGVVSVSLGALSGFYNANATYWANPPDTTSGCP